MEGSRKIGAEVFVQATSAKEELGDVQQSVRQVGEEAKRSSSSASAAMNGLNESAKSQAAAFGAAGAAVGRATQAAGRHAAEITKNEAAIRALDGQIKGVERSLARMEALYRADTATLGANNEVTKRTAAEIDKLTAAKGELINKQAALVERNDALSTGTTKTGQGFEKLTSNVSLFSGALGSVNPLLAQVLGGMGGVSLGLGVLVSVLAFAVGKIIELATAKKELISIDSEYILSNQLLSNSVNGFSFSHAGLTAALFNTAEAQKKLDVSNKQITDSYRFLTEESRQVTHVTSALKGVIDSEKEALVTATGEAQTHQKAVADNVAVLRVWRDVFGISTDELVRMTGAAQGSTAEQERLKRAIDSDIDALRKFAAELANSTGRTFNLEHAVLGLVVALHKLREARINLEAIQGAAGQVGVLERGLATVQGAGVTDRSRQALALDAENAALIERMQRESAILGKTDAERRKIFQNSIGDLRELKPELAQLLDAHIAGEKGMAAFNETAKKGAGGGGALRAYANALVELQRRAEDAEAALSFDALSLQQQRIQNQIQAERQHLQINRRDKEAALGYLDRIEGAMLAKTLQDAAEARHRAAAQQRSAHLRMLQQIERDEKAHHGRLLNQFIDRKRQEEELQLKVARGALAGADSARAAGDAGISAGSEELLERITKLFGGASKSGRIFELQVRAVNGAIGENISLTGQLAAGVQAIAEDFLFSADAALRFGSMIESAMEQAASGASTFGQALKAQVFGLVADMSSAFGDFFIKWGAGQMLLNPAAGIAAIAAGFALKAFAGYMRGKAQGAAESGAAAGGGAGAAAGGGGAAQRPVRGPNIIEFPTSAQVNRIDNAIAGLQRLEHGLFGATAQRAIERLGQMDGSSGRPPVVHVHATFRVDEHGFDKALKRGMTEAKVITTESAKRQHNRALKRAVKDKVA